MVRKWRAPTDQEIDMDVPKNWVYRVSNALTAPMQRHLWAAYSDLVSVAVPDTAPPASATWSLTLGRRVFANDESGSSSQNKDAGTRGATVTRGTLQHHAASPAARAAALRFMGTIDLLLGGAGWGRGRIEGGPFTPEEPGPNPAKSWGGWGGSHGLFGSPRDMCAQVDFSSMHTARIMQCVPGADGKREIDPAEIDAAADAVRARCGVPSSTDIMPFRLAGLGTCVTIEVGSSDEWRLPEGYDEGYSFYINLRPPNNTSRTVEFHMAQLNMVVPLPAGDVLGFRSAVQIHSIKDGPDTDGPKKGKKKKNKTKKKKRPAVDGETPGGEGEAEAEDDDDSDVEHITSAMGGTSIGAAGPSSSGWAGGSSAPAGSSSSSSFGQAAGPSSSASASVYTAGSSSTAGPSSGPSDRVSGTSSSTPVPDSFTGTFGPTRARSTPPPAAAINFASMPRVMITVWTDIETVANVAMAAKLVWPELQIEGIDSPPPSPTLSPSAGKRPA